MAISNGGQCPQLNSGLGTSHGWLSSMWIERSDTLIHALGYNTTLFAGQSEGSYVLIFVLKKTSGLLDIQCGNEERCLAFIQLCSLAASLTLMAKSRLGIFQRFEKCPQSGSWRRDG